MTGAVTPGTREKTPTGTASAKCSGTDLFAALSNDQVASILAAFPKGNKCSVNLKTQPFSQTSSILIKLEQKAINRAAP